MATDRAAGLPHAVDRRRRAIFGDIHSAEESLGHASSLVNERQNNRNHAITHAALHYPRLDTIQHGLVGPFCHSNKQSWMLDKKIIKRTMTILCTKIFRGSRNPPKHIFCGRSESFGFLAACWRD